MARYTPEGLEKMRVGNELRFMRDAREKFGEQFDYSSVKYLRQKIPVTIICPEHGPFEQTPDKHLQSKNGCPKCGVTVRANKKSGIGRAKFLIAFNKKHGHRLEIVSEYVGYDDSIKFRCNAHDAVFESTPNRLLTWVHGCPLCARNSTVESNVILQREFLRRAEEKFGQQFDLSQVKYKKMNQRVDISCPIHSHFRITPAHFLKNTHGCPKCGKLYVGYAANRIERLEQGLIKPRPTRIAVMKIMVYGITAFKVGVTNRTLVARYGEALRGILFEAKLDELDALKLEKQIHAKYFRFRDIRIFLAGLKGGKRWSGDSEIYDAACIPRIIAELNTSIEDISAGNANYWDGRQDLSPPILRFRSARKVPGAWNKEKPVIRLDTLERFPSATAAAKAIKSSQGLVSAVCRGKRGQTKGIPLAFVSDYESGTVPHFKQRLIGKDNPRARRVRCVDTGQVFDTIGEAAKATGALRGKIGSACEGKRKSAGGYRWEYLD